MARRPLELPARHAGGVSDGSGGLFQGRRHQRQHAAPPSAQRRRRRLTHTLCHITSRRSHNVVPPRRTPRPMLPVAATCRSVDLPKLGPVDKTCFTTPPTPTPTLTIARRSSTAGHGHGNGRGNERSRERSAPTPTNDDDRGAVSGPTTGPTLLLGVAYLATFVVWPQSLGTIRLPNEAALPVRSRERVPAAAAAAAAAAALQAPATRQRRLRRRTSDPACLCAMPIRAAPGARASTGPYRSCCRPAWSARSASLRARPHFFRSVADAHAAALAPRQMPGLVVWPMARRFS